MTSRISFEALHRFTVDALCCFGVSETDATTTADVLVTTDVWGVFTHGTKALAGYLRRLKLGGLNPLGIPKIIQERGGLAIVDGDSSLGMVTSVFATQQAIARAREHGISYVGVRNSCHFGAAGYYAWMAAREGLIGISMANDIPSVAAPGSRGPVTGSNPLAYAIPAGKFPPILLDMSTATVAGGKVYAAKTRGEKIPDSWLLDGAGRPTTDPSCYPESGTLRPAAGHKGYGLALLIESLSGILSGAAITWGVGSWMWDDGLKPTKHGAAFLVIDGNALMPAQEFTQKVEALIEEVHNVPRAEGVDRLFVPGEMEWERRDRALREGIALPEDVVANVEKAAAFASLKSPFA